MIINNCVHLLLSNIKFQVTLEHINSNNNSNNNLIRMIIDNCVHVLSISIKFQATYQQ